MNPHTFAKLALVSSLSLAGVIGCSDTAPPESVEAGRSLRPMGTEATEVPIPMNSVYFFENDGFRGNAIQADNLTLTAHEMLNVAGPAADRMSSVRWNLPPGVVVTLHEHAEGKGDQMAIWGQGQAASMTPWDFNDKLSRWSWHNVGGVSAANAAPVPLSPRPLGASPTVATLPTGVIEMYADRGLRGGLTTVGPIHGHAMGVRHNVTGLADQLTSLRWNLPPGVVVVFYEDAFGPGEQLVIWGSGQYESVSQFDFNDKASKWAWYDLRGGSTARTSIQVVPANTTTTTTVITPAPGVVAPGVAPGVTTQTPAGTTITETKTTTVRTETVPAPR